MNASADTPHLAATLAAARAVEAHLSKAAAALKRLSNAPEEPLQSALTGPDLIAAHRREHRKGVPGKIETDPEPEAFIRARFATLTFPRIAAEVASTFPPDRRASQSSIHRRWRRNQPER